ncbi:MAG: flagellar biosynthesis anti-sigma factor FlgM [Burkholderiales bacterium]|nr:flagellar biosynthesis anti-sigma factor FlgM [Burkholderiales bacterium]
MKINGGGSIKPVNPTGVGDVSAGKASGPQTPATPAAARDKVEITSLSAQLAQLEKMLNDVSVVDAARVDAVKQAISEGRFQIDSEVVADKLLSTVRELLVNQQA